jgi:hypothetical protein
VDRAGFVPAVFDRPIPVGTSLLAAGMVDAGAGKRLSRASFETATLRRRACVAITVIPAELARAPQSLPTLNALLAAGNAAGLNAAFVSEVVEAGTAVSSGSDPVADLRALLAAFIANGGQIESAVILMSSRNAVGAALLAPDAFRNAGRQGGVVAGLPMFASDAAPDIFAVVDAAKVFVADEGQVVIDISTATTLEMSDDPTSATVAGSPPEPTATTAVSMFQTDSAAIRCERIINWLGLSGAAAFTHADYLS